MNVTQNVNLNLKASGFRRTAKQIDGVNRSSGRAAKSVRNLQAQTNRSRGLIGGLVQSVRSLGSGLASLRAILLTLGIATVFRNLVGVVQEFEQTMANVLAISNATAEEFMSLTGIARELGATTVFSARQAAQGLVFLSQAGFSATESVRAIPQVLGLAQAGGLGLAESAQITANVVRGLGLNVSELTRVTDVFAKAASSSFVTVSSLGQAFSFVAPIARAARIPLEEITAAISLLGDAGIASGRAGRGLVNFISQLQRATPRTVQVLEKYGLTARDVNIQTQGFRTVIQRIIPLTRNLSDTFAVFGKRGGQIAAVIGQNVARLDDLIEGNNNAEGSMRRMARTMTNTLRGAWLSLVSAVQESTIRIGDAGFTGALTNINKVVAGVVSVFNGMRDQFLQNNDVSESLVKTIDRLVFGIRTLADIMVVVGARFIAVRGLLLGYNTLVAINTKLLTANIVAHQGLGFVITRQVTGFAALRANGVGALRRIFGAASNLHPALRIVAGLVTAIGAAYVALNRTSSTVFGRQVTGTQRVLFTIRAWVGAIFSLQTLQDLFTKRTIDAFNSISKSISGSFRSVTQAVISVIKFIGESFSSVGKVLASPFLILRDIVVRVSKSIGGIIDTVIGFISRIAKEIAEYISSFLDFGKALDGISERANARFKELIEGLDGIGKNAKDAGDAINGISVPAELPEDLFTVGQRMESIADALTDAIVGAQSWGETMRNILRSIAAEIVKSNILELFQQIGLEERDFDFGRIITNFSRSAFDSLAAGNLQVGSFDNALGRDRAQIEGFNFGQAVNEAFSNQLSVGGGGSSTVVSQKPTVQFFDQRSARSETLDPQVEVERNGDMRIIIREEIKRNVPRLMERRRLNRRGV